MDPTYNPWATPLFPNNAAFGTGSPQEDAQRAPNLLDNLLSRVAGALGRGFMAPGQALQSTEPITTEQMIKPAADIAGSITLGAGAIPADLNALRMGIKAYHGSPHDFDRFDISKIGTGEGAQAYGHGLYFAENEGVAKGYRNTLADWKVNGAAAVGTNPSHIAAVTLKAFDGDPAKAITDLMRTTTVGPQVERDAAAQAIELIRGGGQLPKATGGHMYEVNLNADPAHFLDWDKPLGQQGPTVQSAVKQAMGEPNWNQFRSADAGTAVKQGFIAPGEEMVATKLREAGVPGIRYLDQGSRGAGQGSSNYVMFDDKLIDILRKYGIAGMTAPPIFANAMSEQKQ